MADLEALERLVAELAEGVRTSVAHGELTAYTPPDRIVHVLTACRDDERLDFDLLVDLSGVHWPGGLHAIDPQLSTTGWPEQRVVQGPGGIEVTYHLLSTGHNHRLRIVVTLDEDAPRIPSVVAIYPTANYHEREVYDFFGVVFDGHPELTRILMPDDWVGHPQRKDYPLGGVTTPYHGAAIEPPDERVWSREVPR